MSDLILIRHSNTRPSADCPKNDWPLTAVGMQRAHLVASALRRFALQRIYTSTMERAVKTGDIIADHLGLPKPQQTHAFDETDRSGVPYFDSHAQFQLAIEQFLVQKDQVVMGTESAEQALARFQQGVDQLSHHSAEPIAIVSHGTVMSLFLADCSDQSPVSMWHQLQDLGMPHFVVVDRESGKILEKQAV